MAGFLNKSNVNIGEGSRIDFKLVGRWEETIRTVQKMGPAVKASSIRAQVLVATEIIKKVKGHLRKQDLNWKPLSSYTIESKARYGLDGRILWAYGNYYNNIEQWKTSWNGHMVFVGVKKGKYGRTLKGKRNKIDIATVAAIHEFSSGKRIPRRPLWNPTIKEMGGVKGIQKMYLNLLFVNLKSKGIPVKKISGMF